MPRWPEGVVAASPRSWRILVRSASSLVTWGELSLTSAMQLRKPFFFGGQDVSGL